MKLNFWIFLTVGIIILAFIYLRKKEKLELAIGVTKPGIEPGITNGIEKLPDYLPGTDIPVGLRPRPGNGLLGRIGL